jgi:putative ABC transport system permease protein
VTPPRRAGVTSSPVIAQARANLRRGRVQALLVLVSVTAAAALLTVASSTMGAATGGYDRLFDRTDGAHVWLQVDAALADTTALVARLRALPGVVATTDPRPTVRGADLRLGDGRATVHLRDWVPDDEPVARLALLRGAAPGAPDEVALDHNVVTTHDLALGDTIELLGPDGWRPLRLVAVTASAEMCPYPTCQPTVVHLGPGGLAASGIAGSEAATDAGAGPEVRAEAIGVRIDPEVTDPAAVLDEVEATISGQALIMAHDADVLRETTSFLLRVQAVFLLAFGVVAALAAAALVANAVGEAVRAQYRQIGLLKAVGFTRGQVARTYLSQQLGLALAGSVLGLGIGLVAAWAALRSVAEQFGADGLRPPWWVLVVVPAAVLVITTSSTLLPVRHASSVDAITAIRTGAAAKPRQPTRLLRRVPAPVATGVADLRARPARTLVTTATLAAAVVALTFASTAMATLDWFSHDPDAGFRPAAELTMKRPPLVVDAEVRAVFAAEPDVLGVAGDIWYPFRLPEDGSQLQLRAIAGAEHLPVALLEGRTFERAGEVIAGYGISRDHGFEVGTRRTIEIDGTPVEVDVVGVYREGSNLGQLLMTDVATLTAVNPDVAPFEYHVRLADGSDAPRIAADLAAASDQVLSPVVTAEQGLGILDSMPAIIGGLSVVLVVVALFGVLATVWMGVQERRRETGLLAAVGMTPRQTLAAVLIGSTAMAVVAYGVGLPLGVLGTERLLDLLARQLGFGPLAAQTDPLLLAAVLPAVVAVALLGSALPAVRSARTPVAEALRHE